MSDQAQASKRRMSGQPCRELDAVHRVARDSSREPRAASPCVIHSRPMDFRLTDEQQLLRASVREFAEAEIRPHVMEWDEAQQFPMDLLPKLAALGLMGIQFPRSYGGVGHVGRRLLHLHRGAGARRARRSRSSVAAHNGLCTAHIDMFGSEAQKRTYLPRLVRGEVLGAWGLTEAERRQRRGRDADDRDAARRRAGCSTAPRPSSRTAASAA